MRFLYSEKQGAAHIHGPYVAYHQFPCHGRCAWAYLSCTRSWCHLHCDNDTAVWNGQRASMNLHLSACPGMDSYLQFKYDFLTLPWPCCVRHKRAVLHTSLRIAMSPLWFHPAIMPIKIWLHCKWILDTAPLPRDLQKTFVLNGPLSGHYIYKQRRSNDKANVTGQYCREQRHRWSPACSMSYFGYCAGVPTKLFN